MNLQQEITNLKKQDQKLIERILESRRSSVKLTSIASQNTLNQAETKTLETQKLMDEENRGLEGMIRKMEVTMEEGLQMLADKIDERADEIMDRLDSLESNLGAKIDAVGSAVQATIQSLKATIASQEQTIADQAATIADLEEQLANAGSGSEEQP